MLVQGQKGRRHQLPILSKNHTLTIHFSTVALLLAGYGMIPKAV